MSLLCAAIYYSHHATVMRMRPFNNMPYAAFASNWLTAPTWVPGWSAYHSRSTE